MLSTYRVNGFPTVDEGHWPEKHSSGQLSGGTKGKSFNDVFTNPFGAMMAKAMAHQFEKLTSKDGFSKKYPVAMKGQGFSL